MIYPVRKSIEGSGLPLVLVNGMFQSVDSWSEVVTNLSRFYKVITFDMPNQGEAPTDPDYRHISVYAQFVKEMLAEIGIDSKDTVIFGYSFGSGIVRCMSSVHNIRFRAMILGGAVSLDLSPYLIRRFSSWLSLIEAGLFDNFASIALADIFSPHFVSQHSLEYDNIIENFKSRYAHRADAAANLIASVVNYLKEYSNFPEKFYSPVHIIAAEHDIIVPLSYVKKFAEQIGAESFQVIPGGHTSRIEALPELIQSLTNIAETYASTQ